jgi:anti-sigma factor RsiW
MNQRDLELLSSYLDGQLSPSDITQLEARLNTDPQLVSVLNELRATRTLLRKLPQRRAPRNFTLTRKMVGLNPPLPRVYPFFRLTSAVATLLFLFSFGLNSMGRYASQIPVYGMGGGGAPDELEAQSFAAEAATEGPMEGAATGEPAVALAPAPTLALTKAADEARVAETPVAKSGGAENTDVQNQLSVESEAVPPPLVSPAWQVGLAVVAVLGVLLMFVMKQAAMNRWK